MRRSFVLKSLLLAGLAAFAAGAFAQMTPNLEHAIRARTEVVMLLIMNKGARQ